MFFLERVTKQLLLHWQWYPCKECCCMIEYYSITLITKHNFVSQDSDG